VEAHLARPGATLVSAAVASFTLVREIDAPPEVVFDVLTDHRGYADITRVRRAELEREGEPAPNGVGAIRALYVVGPPMREEVLAYERPSRFSYTVLSGLPVRDHVGTAELTPQGSGTRIVYAVRSTPTPPLGGGLVIAGIKLGIEQLLDGVAAEARKRVPAGS
jgi:uncharacterized protein YndB with AHSA1/START domain